jgi:hypothetical protein
MQIWRYPPRHKPGSSRTLPAEIFFPPHEPPHLVYKRSRRHLPAVLSRARSRSRTRDTPAPRQDRALPSAPRCAAHLRVPTSPTPLQRPRRLCHLDACAFSAATVRVDNKLVGTVYDLCRVYNPFEWSVSTVWTGYGVVLTTSELPTMGCVGKSAYHELHC